MLGRGLVLATAGAVTAIIAIIARAWVVLALSLLIPVVWTSATRQRT